MQTRLLRDLLNVLPGAERGAAVAALGSGKADLTNHATALVPHLQGRIVTLLGGNARLAKALTVGMPAIQQATF